MRCGSLFSGVGLLDYGLTLAGFEHAWLCEVDPWRRELLALRWPEAVIYDDIRTVASDAECGSHRDEDDSRAGQSDPARGDRGSIRARSGEAQSPERVDLIAGGFPCKGISAAGRREGFGHPETVLWREQARVIRNLQPRYVLVENVANLLTLRGGECFAEVIGDLAASGYSCWWDVLPAAAVGAPHLRERVFIVGYAESADADEPQEQRDSGKRRRSNGRADAGGGAPATAMGRAQRDERPVKWGAYRPAVERWEAIIGRSAPLPLVRRVDDGTTPRIHRSRLSGLGDGVQVQVAELIGRMIIEHAREQ